MYILTTIKAHRMGKQIVKDNYFIHHYSHVNNIDPNSEESVRRWLNDSLKGVEREIGSYVHDVQHKKILELGCGIGGVMNFLISRGATDILGVDHSTDQLAVCKICHSKCRECGCDRLSAGWNGKI